MSAPDGKTPQAVDFDGLDSRSADDSRRSRVVSFDDMEPDPGQVDARSRVVSFDGLDAPPDAARGAGRRAASFENLDPGPDAGEPDPDAAARRVERLDEVAGPDAGGAGAGADPVGIVSFDGLDSGAGADARRSAGRGERRGSGTGHSSGGPVGSTSPDRNGGAGRSRGTASVSGPADDEQAAGGADTDPARRDGRGRAGGARRGAARGGPGGERNGRGARSGRTADASTPQDDETRAREICLRLLTDRARTVKELADTLRRKEIPEDVATKVLERFDEVGLVDDEAFAGQWVRSRHHHKGLGRRAIAMELHRKGVARETADEALAEIDPESEQARARELVDRKMRSMRVDTKEHRASTARRLVGMLARKGYGPGVAYGVVRDAIAARGAEEDELGEGPVD